MSNIYLNHCSSSSKRWIDRIRVSTLYLLEDWHCNLDESTIKQEVNSSNHRSCALQSGNWNHNFTSANPKAWCSNTNVCKIPFDCSFIGFNPCRLQPCYTWLAKLSERSSLMILNLYDSLTFMILLNKTAGFCCS